MTVHPDRPPNQPYFRGVSDLPGEFGDLFYGPYGRSTNHYVKDGSTVRKRDGFVRAYDEHFEGSASVLFHRDGATRYQLVADGEGVKVLASLPPSFYTGVSSDHHGFANDDFDRADSGTVTAAGAGWREGQDSDEVAGRTLGDEMKILGNDLRLDSTEGSYAGLDWPNRAPSLFYGYRIEVDFTSLALAATNDEMILRFFLGLPDLYTQADGVTVGRERQYAVDANTTWGSSYPGGMGQDTCWQGLACELSVKQESSGEWRVSLKLSDFLSNKEEASKEIRLGRLDVVNELSETWAAGTAQDYWVLEFGRRKIRHDVWKRQARVWKNKTIADIESGAAHKSNTSLSRVSSDLGADRPRNGFYRSLSKDGSGGFFGMIASFNKTTIGSVDIPEIKATTSLVK